MDALEMGARSLVAYGDLADAVPAADCQSTVLRFNHDPKSIQLELKTVEGTGVRGWVMDMNYTPVVNVGAASEAKKLVTEATAAMDARG